MLWLAGTGSTIQVLDLTATLTHLSPADPTVLSMAEGMYGPGNFAVIQVRDFDSTTFPEGFNFRHAVEAVLQAASSRATGPEQLGGAGGTQQSNQISWLELRMVNGAPVGQIMVGPQLAAFDTRTREPVQPVPPIAIPQGGRLPPSLRQKFKTLHRFWNRGDTPGVYFEFVAGLILWMLLITGLVMYFQLLKARSRIGRRQLFWLSGGLWRGLHRTVSVVAATFLICMAFSGTWIGYESSFMALGRQISGRPAPLTVTQLQDADIRSMTAVTLEAMQRLRPGTPIKALRLRTYGQMKQGVVITGGDETDQIVFNADTGQTASLTEPSYPKSGFPFGVQVHENIKHFHSGEMFGLTGQFMNLFAGLSLLFLSVSGLTVYLDLWSSRRKAGRGAFIWR